MDLLAPGMAYVGVQVVAFDMSDIEPLLLHNAMTMDALMDLRMAGKGKTVSMASVVTQLQQEAIVKDVQEVIYPSECSIMTTNGLALIEPQNYTMREVGSILQVIVKMDMDASDAEDNMLYLCMRPQWVELERYEPFPTGPNTAPFLQPVFSAASFEASSLMMRSGDTILLGSSSTPDGKSVRVWFLTAKGVPEPVPAGDQ